MLRVLGQLKGKICGEYRTLMVLGCLAALAVPVAGCDPTAPRQAVVSPEASPARIFTDTTAAPSVPVPAGSAAAGPAGSRVTGPGTQDAGTADTPSPGGPGTHAPNPTHAPRPAGASSSPPDDTSVSGQRLPVGDLPGWRQVFAGDFIHGDVPIGEFPGAAYRVRWSAGYADGTPDTAGQVSGGKSGYYPTKVLSVRNGVLDWYLHSEHGISMGAAPSPIIANTSTGPHRPNSQLYGRYSVRFKADSLPGFKTAWLMWPDSGVWPRDGELDYPEGDLAGPFFGAVHRSGSSRNIYEVVPSRTLFTSWHTATTEWTPGRVTFLLDGKPLGTITTGTPVKPMHYILQTESCLTGCPRPGTAGHVQVAWVAVWARS